MPTETPQQSIGQDAARENKQNANTASKSSKNKPVELLVWDAPNRKFDPKSPQWFLGLFALGLFGVLIFAIFREILLVLLVVSGVFVAYALAKVEPDDIEHRVFNTGIQIGDKFYSWDEDLKSFWIQRSKGQSELQLETKLFFPHTLELLLPEETPEEDLDELQELLIAYLPEKERDASEMGSFADNAILSISDKLPFRQKMLGWIEKRIS